MPERGTRLMLRLQPSCSARLIGSQTSAVIYIQHPVAHHRLPHTLRRSPLEMQASNPNGAALSPPAAAASVGEPARWKPLSGARRTPGRARPASRSLCRRGLSPEAVAPGR